MVLKDKIFLKDRESIWSYDFYIEIKYYMCVGILCLKESCCVFF